MTTADTGHNLELLDTTAGDGCGCGGCGCGSSAKASTPADHMSESTASSATPSKETTMNTMTYSVTGMTCGHCASAVTSELASLFGVTDVEVDLVAGGTSTVTVSSTQPLQDAEIAAALEEAGDYQLA